MDLSKYMQQQVKDIVRENADEPVEHVALLVAEFAYWDGHSDGESDGRDSGWDDGHSDGYEDGFQAGKDSVGE